MEELTKTFFEKIKKSIIINFMIENCIANISIEYNEIDKEINMKCTKNEIEYTNNYKIPKKRGKYKKKNSNAPTPITTDDKMDSSVTDLDEEDNNLQNNTEKHVLNETELLNDEEQIHHEPKHAKKENMQDYNRKNYENHGVNIYNSSPDKNDVCDTDDEIPGLVEEENVTDNKMFNKDKFCLELLDIILMYEKKILQKYNLTELKNIEILLDKIKDIFINLGFKINL
jgi:hypothetical protein